MAVDLSGKRAIVTGANTGIGEVTARELMRMGAKVIYACRSEDKARAAMDAALEDVKGGQAEYLSLDLSSLESVRKAAEELLADGEPIDLLINNAGLAGSTGKTRDGFELAFGVNHLGHFLFTELLLDRIKETPKARIVNVASEAHYRAKGIDWQAVQQRTKSKTAFPEYCVSKLANVLYSRHLAERLAQSEVNVYSLHPGVVASDIWRSVPWPFSKIIGLFMLSTDDGAKTTLYCATSPACAQESGLFYDDSEAKEPSKLAKDDALAEELVRRSREWVGLA